MTGWLIGSDTMAEADIIIASSPLSIVFIVHWAPFPPWTEADAEENYY